MALKPLQAQLPLGQFDGLDTELTLFLGGEVCNLVPVSTTGTDKHAADIDDGYAGASPHYRPAVSYTLTVGRRPLLLADDGTRYYGGSSFGEVVGGFVGVQGGSGIWLGPHSALGSGKITIWDKPGLYAVTLDAVDAAGSGANLGLVPSNNNLSVSTPLYARSNGKLTPDVTVAYDTVVVARFIEFTTNGSRVTTPNTLAQALNSPVGSLPVQSLFVQAVIHFAGPGGE